MRLVGDEEIKWDNRGHFFAAAARAMRCILVDRARRRAAGKHGGGQDRLELGDVAIVTAVPSDDLLALDSALTKLQQRDERKAEVVHLRYFAGLTVSETARAMGISPRLVSSEWTFARAWLARELAEACGDTE